MAKILAISATDVKKLTSMRDIIEAVEEAFRALGKGACKLAPVILTMIDRHDGEHEIKSGYVEEYCIGAKIITFYAQNRARRNLPALSGIIVLNDLEDGRPLAVIDGTYVTAARTGAAGAVAAKYLARKDSENVAIIGAGTQGRYQLAALNEIFKIASVQVYDISAEHAAAYAKEMTAQYRLKVEQAESASQAVADADIIVTATPSTKAIIMKEWIREGTHINAIGADAPGKQELDPAIAEGAKVVVDSIPQCIDRGEIQTAIRLGRIKKEDIHAELSDIILGRKLGRSNDKEVTLFDATGLAVQDITTAYRIYQLAKEQGLGAKVDLS